MYRIVMLTGRNEYEAAGRSLVKIYDYRLLWNPIPYLDQISQRNRSTQLMWSETFDLNKYRSAIWDVYAIHQQLFHTFSSYP